MTQVKKTDWICTDPDTQQYGRRVTDNDDLFEFKEMRDNGLFQTGIDLGAYTHEQIEDCINTYGYTLQNDNGKSGTNIYELYGNEANWIMAECLFEQTTE